MAKRSIKDSMNSDAAFAFVKGGFEQPPKTNLVTMPKTEQVVEPEETKPVEPPKKSKPKSEKPISKPKAAKNSNESDHLVSVSTRMRSGLFADLKKEALLRQLDNQTPNSLQEILTEAAEEWMKKNKTSE